ncbi:MAG: hypothetical protein EBX64_02265, partial [Betaproteobacteria bacterium]|nr:hypothetical protein [Betaproteobacteria bacterium]
SNRIRREKCAVVECASYRLSNKPSLHHCARRIYKVALPGFKSDLELNGSIYGACVVSKRCPHRHGEGQVREIEVGAGQRFIHSVFLAYDTEYAMVDRSDDIHLGIKTSAITFGRYDVAMVMLSYAITLALLAFAGRLAALGLGWWLGLLAAAGIALYHYWLIKDRQVDACFKAFNHNNWFGAAVFCGLVLDRYMSQAAS